MSVAEALDKLLKGTGLAYSRTSSGTFVIRPARVAVEEPAVPEILVIGRRTQNEDIRRTENDIQPYQVVTSLDIGASHSENVDQVLRKRLPDNASSGSPSQSPAAQFASNRSEINLHGLGANQTLVLLDGVRMPGIPVLNGSPTLAVYQPDLNGIPLFAIDRIEALTGTAGGIYGPGATGGVLNIVLKRNYRGAELGLSYGLSEHGDAPRKRIDGRFGFTPDHGRTDIMVAFSRSVTEGLRLGDRDFTVRARQILFDQSPAFYVNQGYPINGLVFEDVNASQLVLKRGAAIGSPFTSVPATYGGVSSDGGAQLLANAGTLPITLAPGGSGVGANLTTDTRTTSLLVNIRHRFGDSVEAFVDAIGYQNNGDAVEGGRLLNSAVVGRDAPDNPFEQNVAVLFPTPVFDTQSRDRARTLRVTVGGVIHLPEGWKGEPSYSWSSVHHVLDLRTYTLKTDFLDAIALDRSGANGEPAPNPFGDVATFLSAVQAYRVPLIGHYVQDDHLQDARLRLAGPLLVRRAGTISLSLLAERRHEVVPFGPATETTGNQLQFGRLPGFSQTVSSLYGELRAPTISRSAVAGPLRGLEFQLAIRYDTNRTKLPGFTGLIFTPNGSSARQSAVAYTAGFRTYPQDFLMFRASAAEGILPPTPAQLFQYTALGAPIFSDPKRGGETVGTVAPYSIRVGGGPDLGPARARTLSVGLVLNPETGNRPRLSLDYRHIDIRHEIVFEPYTLFFLDNEDSYPGRVQRAPLTAQDIAQGFTGGVITQLDLTSINAGRTISDALDLNADYRFRDGGGGTFRLFSAWTWLARLKRREVLASPDTNLVDFMGGPLRWRGNVGIGWDRRPWSIDVNGQYYGRYFAADPEPGSLDSASRAALFQAGTRIPAQFYLDISTALTITLRGASGPARSMTLGFAVSNLLDHRPPVVTLTGEDYSHYGDPSGRRLEFTANTSF